MTQDAEVVGHTRRKTKQAYPRPESVKSVSGKMTISDTAFAVRMLDTHVRFGLMLKYQFQFQKLIGLPCIAKWLLFVLN